MKPFLLYSTYDDQNQRKEAKDNELIKDLQLELVLRTMSGKDPFLYNTAKNVILDSLTDIGILTYRQNVLKDCLDHKSLADKLYILATDTLDEAAGYLQNMQPSYSKIISASTKLLNSVALFEKLVSNLRKLRSLSRFSEKPFQSDGFIRFCSQQEDYLTDDFFINLMNHISDLKYLSEGGTMIIGSGIGTGMKGVDHVLRGISRHPVSDQNGKKGRKPLPGEILLDNSRLANSAREMEDAALIHLLRLINHFNSSMLHYFEILRYETGFYSGCVRLYSRLAAINVPVSFPIPEEIGSRNLAFSGLYDVSLALGDSQVPVSNSLDASGKSLFIITGANQGGKTTFLRSVGIAQIFMQCGMFVPAEFYTANTCDRIITHFTREEDACMNSGKLDEELLRMNDVINRTTVNSMLLVNEPFATTTEREGSEIAVEIVTALYELGVKTLFVTHLFEFSEHIYGLNLPDALFLRAERNDDGSRTFCIRPGHPLRTSFGEDLFISIIEPGIWEHSAQKNQGLECPLFFG